MNVRHLLFPLKRAAGAGLLWLAAVACMPLPAAAATQDAEPGLQSFKDVLTNSRAWLGEGDKSLLDIDILVSKDTGGKPLIRTLDGKPQLAADSDGKLRLAIPFLSQSIPLVAYRGDVQSLRAWRARHKGVDLDALAIQIAKDAGVACQWEYQPTGTVHRTCHIRLDDLLGNLVAWRAAACGKPDESCFEHEGRKWLPQPVPGQMDLEQRKNRLRLALAELLEEALRPKIEVVDRNGKRLDTYTIQISQTSGMNGEPLVLAPSLYSRNVKAGEQVKVATLPLMQIVGASILVDAQLQLNAQAERQQAQAARQANDKAVDALRQHPDAYGALALDSTRTRAVCTSGTVPQGRSEAVADPERLGLLASPAYRQWRRLDDDRFSNVYDSPSSLYTALQRQACQVAVGTGAELAAVAAALKRDGVAFTAMPAFVTADEAATGYAKAKGYASAADLRLATGMGGLSPADLERYRQAGIGSQAAYDAIYQRKRAAGHLRSHGDLIDFLADEKLAKEANITVLEAYSRRMAPLIAQEQARQRSDLAARPYRFTLSCRFGSLVTYLASCLSSGGLNSPLGVRNGSVSEQYESGSLHRLGRDTPDGFVFDGSPSVALHVRNISDQGVLTLEVVDRRTGETIHKDSVPPYRTLTFSR